MKMAGKKGPEGPLCDSNSDCAGDFPGTQAAGAGVNTLGSTIHNCFYAADIGFPSSVRTTMGVGNLNAESDVLAANITLCHVCTSFMWNDLKCNIGILSDLERKSKCFFQFTRKIFPFDGFPPAFGVVFWYDGWF